MLVEIGQRAYIPRKMLVRFYYYVQAAFYVNYR